MATKKITEDVLRRMVSESLKMVLKEVFEFNYPLGRDEIDAYNQGYHADGSPLSFEEEDFKKQDEIDSLWHDYGNRNSDDIQTDFDEHPALAAQHKHNSPLRKVARLGGMESSTRKAGFDTYYDALRKERSKK